MSGNIVRHMDQYNDVCRVYSRVIDEAGFWAAWAQLYAYAGRLPLVQEYIMRRPLHVPWVTVLNQVLHSVYVQSLVQYSEQPNAPRLSDSEHEIILMVYTICIRVSGSREARRGSGHPTRRRIPFVDVTNVAHVNMNREVIDVDEMDIDDTTEEDDADDPDTTQPCVCDTGAADTA